MASDRTVLMIENTSVSHPSRPSILLFLGSCTIVIFEKSSESRPYFDSAFTPSHTLLGMNDAAIQSLMITLSVVVRHILLDGEAEMLLSERNDLVQTLGFD